MPQRLFIAIDLPESAKRRIAGLLRSIPDGVKPVRPEQIHLTLHFLGDVEDEAAARVATALRGVAGRPFTLDLVGGGCFPSPRRPNVLWVGVASSELLGTLHRWIEGAIRSCGLPTESRPFIPHVTVARVSRRLPAGWLEDFLHAAERLDTTTTPVTEFTLYASTRSDQGTVHNPVQHYPLAPSP